MQATETANEKLSSKIIGQEQLVNEVSRIFKIFKNSEGQIRPHFVLTGESGSSKTYSIKIIAEELQMGFLEINAAQLTKEGTSGNSLSKALSPMMQMSNKPTVVFVDEFDKLFISGNSNDSCAHETTTGVQNEFLKVLECDTASVFGDYGKYINVPISNTIFVFAGAFNGEADIDLDRLQEMGVKTEFLGRVGLVYNTKKLSLEDLYKILETSKLLDNYVELFDQNKKDVVNILKEHVKENYEMNTLGARMVNTLINQYFIKGGKIDKKEVKQVTFQNKLQL